MDAPDIVTDTTAQRWSRRQFTGGAAGVAVLGSFATACSGPAAHPLLAARTWLASPPAGQAA